MPVFDAATPLVRVDSADEQYGYMIARFGEPSAWSVESQELGVLPDGRDCERVIVRLGTGDTISVAFVPVRDDDLFASETTGSAARLDQIMEIAMTFSRENPPHHPGTISRFPVPSTSYGKAVAVPMAVLAQDQGRRGIYAPPRVVVVDFKSLQVLGVGEFPGFDPETWPPKHLGPWPPSKVAMLGQAQLQGLILRFGALWCRILEAWLTPDLESARVLPAEIEEALELRHQLDSPGMLSSYERLNPGFAIWLAKGGTVPVR